jgi:hypothetical protein
MSNLPVRPLDPRLDRVVEFDERSRAYPVRAVISSTKPRSYTWKPGDVVLDQGREGACVGFSIAQELAARPAPVSGVTSQHALSIYHRAQQIDEWPGEAYDGTSVLAGMKAAVEAGYFEGYRWAFGEEDLALAVGYNGPAVIGVPWYTGMFEPDENGYVRPEGQLAGGHAILVYGIDVKNGRYKLRNSWGADWGMDGDCFISRASMRQLLSQQGEAVIPQGRKRPH